MNKDGDPRRRTPDRRGRGTGDPRNRRPSRDRTLQPHERQRGDYDLRATLTLFAQGKLLGGTAATRKESTTNVTRRINQFREENGIIRRPEDSSTADYIRVVFHAIDGGYVIRRTIMQSHPDAFSSLEDISRDPRLDATIRYFSLLDSRQPITDRLLFTRLEQTARQYIEDHQSLGDNLIHAAALWKLSQVPESTEQQSVGKLTVYQLNALKLKARGYTDSRIAEELTEKEAHAQELDAKAITTRLQYAYAKLGVFSNTEAIIKAMTTRLITPAFVLEGHDQFDRLSELPEVYRDLALPLLEALIAEGGKAKSYKDLGATHPFRNAKQVRRIVDELKKILGTTDVYHTTIVYAAWKIIRMQKNQPNE